MAIDTAAKRRAISGIYTGSIVVGVTPSVQDAAWRQSAGWGYLGIPVNPPVPPVAGGDTHLNLGHLRSSRISHSPNLGGIG